MELPGVKFGRRFTRGLSRRRVLPSDAGLEARANAAPSITKIGRSRLKPIAWAPLASFFQRSEIRSNMTDLAAQTTGAR